MASEIVKGLVSTVLVVGCRSESVARTTPSASASVAAPVASASASATSSAEPESGFEDQFLGANFDAGASDPTRLTARPGYDAYANFRYGYTIDVPLSFVASPDPTNKDGRQWRLGHLAAMTVNGKRGDDLVLSCPQSPDVTAHTETATSCFATGKRDSTIFWERDALARGALYTLRIQYSETVKAAMEPVVAHVSASWQF
ncbi:MAG TPA: hypothetical protein VH054_04250 [Polyangiaceae bacterium]|nr:hypothetical protein [Polyangiaceae bacterium]